MPSSNIFSGKFISEVIAFFSQKYSEFFYKIVNNNDFCYIITLTKGKQLLSSDDTFKDGGVLCIMVNF